MANLGYLSVELQVTNYTRSNFSIQGANINGSGDSWVTGEQPKVGDVLNEYQTMPVGVMTDDEVGQAGGSVALKGPGLMPVTITFQNPPTALSAQPPPVSVICPPELQYTLQQIDSGEDTHTQYHVFIMPAATHVLTPLRSTSKE